MVKHISDYTVRETVVVFKMLTTIRIEYSYDFTHPYGSYVHPVMKAICNEDLIDTTMNN